MHAAVAALRARRPVILPTDTVYGLCALPFRPEPVERLYRLKGRDMSKPIALLAESRAPRVLDIGVGSGAIALSLKHERQDAHVVGVDVSRDALALARENALGLGIDVELRAAGVDAAREGWELVVSNPPYVDSLEGLQPELRYEPQQALLGEGLHEEIARAAATRLLVFEVGLGQAVQVAAALERCGYRDVVVTPDLAGIDRVVEGSK